MAYSRCGDENHHSLFAIPWVRREVIAAAAAVAAARQQLGTLDAVFLFWLIPSETQALQAARKSCIVQALIELASKFQALQAGRESCIVQALIEFIAKCQAHLPPHSLPWLNVRLWRQIGRVASSRL